MAATTNAWWAKVVPWAPSDYAPPPYTPTDPADINHALFSAFRDNTFQKDGGDYRSGLAAGAGTFVGIAALLLFLLPIVYWVLSGAGGCRRTKAKEPGAGGARFLFWFAWLVVAVGTGFTAYGLFEFSKQVSAVGDDAGFLSDSLTKAQAAATGVSTTLTELQTTTATAIESAATCTGAAVDLTDATNALNEAAAAAAAAASNADLQQGIDKTQEWSHNLTRTEASRIAAVSAFVALCAMFLLCFGVLVRRTVSYGKGAEPRAGCSKHFVRALAVTAVLVVLLGWVAAGAAALVAMVGGDFCQDPDANAKTLPPDNPLKDFYLTCTGTNVVTDSLQAAQQQLLTFAAEMATAFRAEAAAAPACAAAATRQLTAISTAAQNANAALVVALDATSCETANSIYVDAVYESTCQDANRALAAMVLGSVLLFSGLVFLVLLWRLIDTQARAAAVVLEADGPRKRRSSLELPAPSPTTTAAPGTMVDIDLATPAPSSGTTAAGKRFSLVDFDSSDVRGGGGRKGAPLGANV